MDRRSADGVGRGDLGNQTRLQYIQALKCLHTLPSKIDPAKAPGARSRYDDFEATHIINTLLIHSGLFFAWHRWFVQLFETALREECGYSGYQPYWDWARWLDLPTEANPLYDGSATSLSGNGRYIPDRNGTNNTFPIPEPNPGGIYTPPGTGGGYIYQGPLVNWTLHLVGLTGGSTAFLEPRLTLRAASLGTVLQRHRTEWYSRQSKSRCRRSRIQPATHDS